MNPRTYATRFLLIMACVLGFAIAPGPIYAGDLLAECVTNLNIFRGCFASDTTTLTGVDVQQFQGHDVQCTITRNPGNARLFVSATTFGFLDEPLTRNRTCNITIIGTTNCNDSVTVQELSRHEYAVWARLARAECKGEL